MMSLPVSIDPIRSIEWVIALFTFGGGLTLFSPVGNSELFDNGAGLMTVALAHPLMILFWGAFLVVGAILVMYGLWRDIPMLRGIGWFAIIMARIFQVFSTLTVVGFMPLTWIFPLTIALIAVVLWGKARTEVATYASS